MVGPRFAALAFVVACLDSRVAHAETIPMSLLEAMQSAELIAVGEIEALDDKIYVLRIEDILKGDCDDETIRVRRFHDWACAWRWGPYGKGQRLLVMLKKEENATWGILGGDCQGESPIVDGELYCAFSLELPDRAKPRVGKIGEWNERVIVRLSTARHALTEFPKHWDVQGANPRKADGPFASLPFSKVTPISTFDLRRFYASRSPVHRSLDAEAAYERQRLRVAGLRAR